MRRIPTAGVLFAALAVLFAGSAQAAPFTYADAAGDSSDRRASMDIVAVRYDVRQVDKAGPRSLVIEMKLAAPPEARLALYEVLAQADGCRFNAFYRPGAAVAAIGFPSAWVHTNCNSTITLLPAEFRIDGNTLQWSIAMDELPEWLRHGSTFSGLAATARICDPVGNGGPVVDQASTNTSWSYR